MEPPIQAHPQMYLACEFTLLLPFNNRMLLKIKPPAVHRLMVQPPLHNLQRDHTPSQNLIFVWSNPVFHGQNQGILKRLRSNQHQILVPHRTYVFTLRHSCSHKLAPKINLHKNFRIPALVSRNQILCFNHIDPDIPELGREVNF
ncbi:hypothetical protein V8G54_024854 [Vigna mungo]|uniref:Uncharacterized protein n=1 Tax=Vigna mungo TaxID=3915 RepID=A0AAQ3N8A0_VIGMU